MKLLRRKRRERRPLQYTGAKRTTPVVRYYNSDKGDKPVKRVERIQKESDSSGDKRFNRFLKQLPQRIIFIAIVALLLVNLTLSGAVVKIADQESAYRPNQEYIAGVQDVFSSSFLYRTKATLSSEEFEAAVRERFPEVSEAVAVVPLAGRELQVNLRFSEPLMRLTTLDNRQGIVGERGNFIELSSVAIPAQFEGLPVLSLQEQPGIEQGSQLLTSTETALLTLLIDEFDGSTMYRHSIRNILFDVKKREMQVRFDGVEYYARITPERDTREQVGALVATLKQLEEDDQLPNEYIDARVEGRIFVK